jgi:hypothetical protein
MKIANSLWAVVERSDVDGGSFVMREEIFSSRQDARDYLSEVKRSGVVDRPRSLFIRQLRVTNKRG